MVDWFSIKPGDKVRVKRTPITGWRFPVGAPVDLTQQELYATAVSFRSAAAGSVADFVQVMFTNTFGGKGLALANPDDLELVADPVATLHDMRSAGPPAPASCGCDILSLMRVGCRCGYLAKEREASS